VTSEQGLKTSEVQAMAAQAEAEAEAEEAEALAAAAVRARARAIQLRQQAELIGDNADDGAHTEISTQTVKASPQTQEHVRDTGTRMQRLSSYLRRRRTRRAVSACLASLVALAFLVASGYEVWEHREASQRRQRAAEFAAAARQGIVTLTSLDFNHAKEDVQRVIDDSTGTFKDDFQKTTGDFIKVVEQSKVVARGSIAATAVDLTSMTDDSAAVLVVSTSEITNAAGAKQDPRRFRLIVTMNRDGDQLKMSKVEFVP
jgi:Mce-associated membrane protein